MITGHDSGVFVDFGFFAPAWPRIWHRLRVAGIQVEASLTPRPLLKVYAPESEILRALSSRAKNRKPKVGGLMTVFLGLVPVAAAFLVPLGGASISAPVKVTTPETCSKTSLERAVKGGSEDSNIVLGESSLFGGVVSGNLTCNGRRYSYTLESRGSERVLKVRLLDS